MKIHKMLIIALLLTVLTAGCADDSEEGGGGGSPQTVLGEAGKFAILSKSGITNVPTSTITGEVGASPVSGAAIGVTCAEVTGAIFSVDAAGPSPCSTAAAGYLTLAVSDMDMAYADIAGRAPPDFTDLGAGNIDGLTLVPGLYNWTTGVSIPTGVTLSGGPNDVWIFQIAQDLTVANAAIVTLTGGAQAKNIFWQTSGSASIGSAAQFEGTILSQTSITLGAGAVVNGSLLAQTAVNIDSTTVTVP